MSRVETHENEWISLKILKQKQNITQKFVTIKYDTLALVTIVHWEIPYLIFAYEHYMWLYVNELFTQNASSPILYWRHSMTALETEKVGSFSIWV